MQRRYLTFVLLAASLLISACNQNSATAQNSTTSDPTGTTASAQSSDADALVKINDDVITKNLFALFYADKQRSNPNPENPQQQQVAALNELANFMLLAQDAEAQGLDQQESVLAALKLQRLNLLARIAIQNRLQNVTPPDEQLKAIYDEQIANGPEQEFKARHILLKTEDEAKAVITQLDEGADFAELAKEKSTGPSGPKGGDLGWFGPDQMVKPFSAAVASMEDGSYTKQPVQTQFGWHVILREESREVPPPSFDEAKKTLRAEEQQQSLRDYIKELRDKAKVEYVQPKGGEATDKS